MGGRLTIIHRELACPCGLDVTLLRARYVCPAGHEHERLAALATTGRTRPYMFRTGRYPEEEPWRGARRGLFSRG